MPYTHFRNVYVLFTQNKWRKPAQSLMGRCHVFASECVCPWRAICFLPCHVPRPRRDDVDRVRGTEPLQVAQEYKSGPPKDVTGGDNICNKANPSLLTATVNNRPLLQPGPAILLIPSHPICSVLVSQGHLRLAIQVDGFSACTESRGSVGHKPLTRHLEQ